MPYRTNLVCKVDIEYQLSMEWGDWLGVILAGN